MSKAKQILGNVLRRNRRTQIQAVAKLRQEAAQIQADWLCKTMDAATEARVLEIRDEIKLAGGRI